LVFGIMHKLGLVLCGFAIVLAISGYILIGLQEQFQAGLTIIHDKARPMEAAAAEMEINSLELGLAVKGYLDYPDPERIRILEDSAMEFNLYYGSYQRAALTEALRRPAEDARNIFAEFSLLGRELISHKNADETQHASINAELHQLEEMTGKIINRVTPADSADKLSPAGRENLLKFLAIVWAETAETMSMMDGIETGGLETRNEIERELKQINIILRDYSASLPQENRPVWLDELSKKIAHISGLALERMRVNVVMDQKLRQFANYRKQLNDLLDDTIQAQTEAELQLLYANLDELNQRNHFILLGASFLLLIMIIGLLLFASRMVVRPIHRLADAANIISDGDFSHTIDLRSKDELGHLASTFNEMAAKLQAAYSSLREANAELDAKITERTRELTSANQQLNKELNLRMQTELELKAASEAKTMFMGNMSHELRTPLNAILGFSDIMKEQTFGPLGEKYADYAKDIHESGTHLLKLINELLDISRIETGHLTLTEEDFDLAISITACLNMLEAQAKERLLTLTSDIASTMPLLHGDQTRIMQILINITGNAIKFTPPGGVVSVKAFATPEGALQVSITDTGIGIAPADLERVFDAFAQVDNNLARAHEGAGLGLPLAKLLTERHDGTLDISSSPGQGTTVTIIFPASRTVSRRPAPLRVVS
jgi:signal transduction histidine kinase